MKIYVPTDCRALTRIARTFAWISAVSVVLWALMTALLVILDSVTFNDPLIARIQSWPLMAVYFITDVASQWFGGLADKARDDPMWYTKIDEW